MTKLTAAEAYMLLPSHLRSADITTETGEVRDINRWFSELINRIAYEKDVEIERLNEELATLRAQHQPRPDPQEPAESALDKAAREAWGRRYDELTDHHVWESLTEAERNGWRRVVAPFVDVKDEPPKPPTDGELLRQANRVEPIGDPTTFHTRLAATFLRLRAERDGTTTDNRKAV